MKRLDLIKGDSVILRSGDFATIIYHGTDKILYTIEVLNGFGGRLWYGETVSVNINGRQKKDLPSKYDISKKARVKSTLFGSSIKTSELKFAEQ